MIEAAGYTFKVLLTPGHTPGGCCYLTDDIVFCGDTIFAESIGRTDLPGGSYDTLLESIHSKILTLPDETNLLPGHGPATTVGWERKRNPLPAVIQALSTMKISYIKYIQQHTVIKFLIAFLVSAVLYAMRFLFYSRSYWR